MIERVVFKSSILIDSKKKNWEHAFIFAFTVSVVRRGSPTRYEYSVNAFSELSHVLKALQ